MKTVELRQLGITSLSLGYARRMEGNKIKHYTSSLVQQILEGTDPLDLVKAKIIEEEGQEVEFVVRPAPAIDILKNEEISNLILANSPEVERALDQLKVSHMLHQYNECSHPRLTKYVSPITSWINRNIITPINNFIFGLANPEPFAELRDEWSSMEKKNFFREMVSKTPRIRNLPEWGFVRKVAPVSFLTVAFEEGDEQAATDSLVADLKILTDKGLIMGHLKKPSLMMLSDTIGSGKNIFCMFAFVVVDIGKLAKDLNMTMLSLPRKPLSLVGVVNECFEGEIHYLNDVAPQTRYEIEEVNVNTILSSDHVRQIVVNNGLEVMAAHKKANDKANALAAASKK